MKLELWYPIKPFKVTQYFGQNLNPMYKKMGLEAHNGLDMQAIDGQLIYASHDGVVTFTGEDGGGGLGVVIRTEEDYEYLNNTAFFKTIYWHIQKNTFLVKPGDRVKAGTPIARADNTGMSTGTHLHFGLKPVFKGEQDWEWYNVESSNGYKGAIDPIPYFNGYHASDAPRVRLIKQALIITNKIVSLLKKYG